MTPAMRIAVLTVLLVAVLPIAASAKQDPQLEGVYSWKGVDVGVGVAAGGMLAVLFYGPLTDALVLYRIEDGGRRLIGRWVAVGGDGTVHPDVLTRLPDETPSSEDARP